MTTTLKIINAVLILVAGYMSIRAGWSMITGDPEMTALFGKWNIGKNVVMLLGVLSIAGALLLVHPRTYVWGNYVILLMILLLIVWHLNDRSLKGFLTELPFFVLSLVIIWLPHPLAKS